MFNVCIRFPQNSKSMLMDEFNVCIGAILPAVSSYWFTAQIPPWRFLHVYRWSGIIRDYGFTRCVLALHPNSPT